MAAISKLWTCT